MSISRIIAYKLVLLNNNTYFDKTLLLYRKLSKYEFVVLLIYPNYPNLGLQDGELIPPLNIIPTSYTRIIVRIVSLMTEDCLQSLTETLSHDLIQYRLFFDL
jgi:hypothetical protein